MRARINTIHRVQLILEDISGKHYQNSTSTGSAYHGLMQIYQGEVMPKMHTFFEAASSLWQFCKTKLICMIILLLIYQKNVCYTRIYSFSNSTVFPAFFGLTDGASSAILTVHLQSLIASTEM